MKLYDYQIESISLLRNGCILCGGVGSGKSITSLGYYYKEQRGDLKRFTPMKNPKDLYIITTARKRDTLEWDKELSYFSLSTDETVNYYKNKVIVDSWNNIKKYADVKNSFFIFDEQRVIGYGAWTKSFLKIAKNNNWILLSATPGDTWSDYAPVFIANGFYRNITEFRREHIIYNRFSKFPKIDRYVNTGRLIRLRNKVLVDMDYSRNTVHINKDIIVPYDKDKYKRVINQNTRWNIYEDKPIENAGELCYVLRKVVNSDPCRLDVIRGILADKRRVIVFYNYDYELELLKTLSSETTIAEWNGHKHQPIPETNEWLYLVQYNAGSEGWNCIKTDTIVFYSQNYSYRTVTQAAGRIDRLNTPYKNLYYYTIKSKSSIDLSIARALKNKKKFNETRFASGL